MSPKSSWLRIPPWQGRTLREVHLREKTGLTVLALWRSGKPIHIGFASLPLRVGDGLLVQGTVARLRLLHQERDFIILDEDPEAIARPRRAAPAILIGLAALAVAITGWLPIALVSLAGALAMLLTGCLSLDQAYASIDWKSIFLIAGMWPLSTAIQNSGLSNALVKGLLGMAGHAGLILLVVLLLLVTMLLTNIMAGQAAAPIILAPIGLSPRQGHRGRPAHAADGDRPGLLAGISHPARTPGQCDRHEFGQLYLQGFPAGGLAADGCWCSLESCWDCTSSGGL